MIAAIFSGIPAQLSKHKKKFTVSALSDGARIRKYGTASLNKFRTKYADFLDTPYVLHKKDVKVEDGIVYLPLYMAPLLVRRDRVT